MLLFDSGIDAARFVSLLIIGVASILTMIYAIGAFQRIWWQKPDEEGTIKPIGDRLIAPTLLIGLILCWAYGLIRWSNWPRTPAPGLVIQQPIFRPFWEVKI